MTINYSVTRLNEELIPLQLINSSFVRKCLDLINFLGEKKLEIHQGNDQQYDQKPLTSILFLRSNLFFNDIPVVLTSTRAK